MIFEQHLVLECHWALWAFIFVKSIDMLFQDLFCVKNFVAMLADAVTCCFFMVPSGRFDRFEALEVMGHFPLQLLRGCVQNMKAIKKESGIIKADVRDASET